MARFNVALTGSDGERRIPEHGWFEIDADTAVEASQIAKRRVDETTWVLSSRRADHRHPVSDLHLHCGCI